MTQRPTQYTEEIEAESSFQSETRACLTTAVATYKNYRRYSEKKNPTNDDVETKMRLSTELTDILESLETKIKDWIHSCINAKEVSGILFDLFAMNEFEESEFIPNAPSRNTIQGWAMNHFEWDGKIKPEWFTLNP